MEFCYTSECGHAGTPPEQQSDFTREICGLFEEMIVQAGGSGMLEGNLCPLVAMGELSPKPEDTPEQAARKVELCQKLNIIGFGPLFD